jgi:8-oxo-dGTP diphosphatase
VITYNFCPQCGTKLDLSKQPIHCENCNKSFYNDPKPGVGVLPIKDGKVLLARRARDPLAGAIDVIGGFIEPNEHPEAGAVREAKEETGLDLAIISLLGIYTDRYGVDGEPTINIHYIAEVRGGEMRAQDDVSALDWVDIDDAPVDEGFKNTQEALKDLKKWYAASNARR